MAGKQGVLMLATLVLAAFFGVSTAKTVTVGDSTGWTIPPAASFYPNWAAQQKLQVGDSIVFTFPTGAHTVAQVSKADYDACTTTNPIGAVMTTAPSTITLTSAGTHYFICTVGGHCSNNQKVAVTVAAAASAPAPKMAPTPAPKMAPTSAPKMAPTSAPVPTPKMAPTPATAPAANRPAVTPSPVATPPMPTTLPTGSPSDAAGGPTPPPQGNSAASTGVTLLSLLTIVAAFLVC